MKNPAIILTIAGSDCSGGAGIQADIKTISALGAYAASVITAITAQNTTGVQGVMPVTPEMVSAQIDSVMNDLSVDAVKIGMVNDPDIVHAIANGLRRHQPRFVVYDPVMVSTSGCRLMAEETVDIIKQELFPLSTLITPNLHEVSLLMGRLVTEISEMEAAAEELALRHNTSVLVKGGHLDGNEMCDVLFADGHLSRFSDTRIETANLHGTGCTLSSAIATFLGMGKNLKSAVKSAKTYLTGAIRHGSRMEIGHGQGPVWHMHNVMLKKKLKSYLLTMQ
ncbi:MAG: bifunctional hydroxymethylpyrimidine kinase/phosphomethylpyrimidine kinase [Bacteroidales bacterium]|nr:bifunctional hydroxymethylpyrimidine kinase/phosphomethylpyrimidine kinase [Bacteroidales bacterium]